MRNVGGAVKEKDVGRIAMGKSTREEKRNANIRRSTRRPALPDVGGVGIHGMQGSARLREIVGWDTNPNITASRRRRESYANADWPGMERASRCADGEGWDFIPTAIGQHVGFHHVVPDCRRIYAIADGVGIAVGGSRPAQRLPNLDVQSLTPTSDRIPRTDKDSSRSPTTGATDRRAVVPKGRPDRFGG